MKSLYLILLITTALFYTSCKKDNITPPIDEVEVTNNIIILENGSYNQLQIVSVEKAGISHSADLYPGMVGSDSVGVIIGDGLISFIAPLTPQPDVTLKVTIDGVEFESTSFSVLQIPIIASPNAVFNDLLNLKTSITSFTNVLIDSMTNYPATFNTSTYSSDQIILDNHWNIVNQNFQSLSSTEKEYVATFIKANEQLFQDCVDAIEDFTHVIPPYLPKSIDVDLEELNRERAEKMIFAATKAARIIGLAAAGGLFASVFATPIGGFVTTGIILGLNGNIFENLIAEYNIFKHSAISLIMDDLTMTKVNLNLDNNVIYPLEIKSTYRSINNQTDFSSALMSNVKNSLNFITDKYTRISDYFSFTTPIVRVEDITTYETFNLDIHAKYLTISDISNYNVGLVSETNNNGTLDVKFRNYQPGTTQNFTFNLNYNSEFGTASKNIDASISGALPLSWVYLQSDPDSLFDCTGQIHWEFTGGESPYELKGYSNGSLMFTNSPAPTTDGPWSTSSFCSGSSFTITVTDNNGSNISQNVTF